ncbi:MAG: YjjG family noncanonical pyrimidine nucleotidase [Duncaniella sp.]|nr:YjjG family noncanonical pyrimidine nucleotidase [Duncaniella sp.]MDE5961742.1 YjjG family noncanonical pyrimidine nucleotidase [Duncaniella sp.]
MKYKWIWFDLDDTLIDFHANSRMALRIIYDECRLDRFFNSPDEWAGTYESHNLTLWARYSRAEITQEFLRIDRFATPLRPHWEGDEESLKEFSRKLDPLYLTRLAEQTALVEGACEILAYLRAHDYNIGILSNGFKDVQHRKLTHTGLDRFVDLTVLSDDIGINKPDPRLYRHAMERASTPDPSLHVMIGDNRDTDIAGALAAGWKAVLFDDKVTAMTVGDKVTITPRLDLLKELF